MATKKKAVRKPRITTLSQLKAAQAEYAGLVESVQIFIRSVRNEQPDSFRMDLAVKTAEGKDHLFNVSSLLASVLTANGLGKQVRLVANPDPKGGTLGIRFFDAVSVKTLEDYIYGRR